MMSTAENIKKIRVNLCMTQDEFAKVLQIKQSTIGNYERGKRWPRLSVIKKLRALARENGMDYSVEDFLNDK